jgi:regulatory protein
MRQQRAKEVLGKLMRYCAYQERSEWEVRKKLEGEALEEEEKEGIIQSLIKENFLSESRFISAYIRGKVLLKRWGIYKITEGLRLKGIATNLTQVYREIDRDLYEENLSYLIDQKQRVQQEADGAKLYRYLLGKGYESDVVVAALKEKKLM